MKRMKPMKERGAGFRSAFVPFMGFMVQITNLFRSESVYE